MLTRSFCPSVNGYAAVMRPSLTWICPSGLVMLHAPTDLAKPVLVPKVHWDYVTAPG